MNAIKPYTSTYRNSIVARLNQARTDLAANRRTLDALRRKWDAAIAETAANYRRWGLGAWRGNPPTEEVDEVRDCRATVAALEGSVDFYAALAEEERRYPHRAMAEIAEYTTLYLERNSPAITILSGGYDLPDELGEYTVYTEYSDGHFYNLRCVVTTSDYAEACAAFLARVA